jgi:hypothetical protein
LNIREQIVNQMLIFSEALVPVNEIAQMPYRPKRFRYEECKSYLEGIGKDIGDFYFNKFAPFSWFAYWRDYVLIDIPAFNPHTLEAMVINQVINLETTRLQTCLQKGDYTSFFYLVDSRIALEAYLKLFPRIPDQDKYRLFWYTFSRCNLKLEDFQPEFILNLQNYRHSKLKLPHDQQNRIEIYRGHILESPVSQSSSWTLDINTAIYFSRRRLVKGHVYRGKIHKNQVVANVKYRNYKEIICFPGDIEEVEEMQFLSLTDIMPELERQSIMKLYRYYCPMIKNKCFHKPGGIHGISHTRRVLLLSLILSWMEGLSKTDRDLLCQAAIYHDIGRSNDNFDPGHGRESYQKVLQYGLFNGEIESQEIVRFIIENHCISDYKAERLVKDYKVTDSDHLFKLYLVFKDADGLDRIRINDLDVKQLRTPSAHKLLLVARELLEDTEGIIRKE